MGKNNYTVFSWSTRTKINNKMQYRNDEKNNKRRQTVMAGVLRSYTRHGVRAGVMECRVGGGVRKETG